MMPMAKLSERVVETKELLKEHLLLDVVGEIIKYTLPLKDDDYNIGLVGNFELCLKVIDINKCFIGACEGGHMEIVKYMISKGANNWEMGLYFACKGRHIGIVKYMVSKGANNWNDGLFGACYKGHMEIVKYMESKGANDWNYGLLGSCKGGHVEIMKYMIEKGANECEYCRKKLQEH
jgi:ankyrin repeat protein